MRRITAWALAFLMLLPVTVQVSAEVPQISAQAAVLYDPLTETVLYAHNADAVMPMASTTKIMTALLAFESGRTDDVVEITEQMTAVEGSSMGLLPGDKITLGELTRGMLLASGNDAANAVAVFLAGSAEEFASMMNTRGAELGMQNTKFVTPSGLDAEGHGSTALDMAKLAAAAMACTPFRETVGQIACTVRFESPEKSVRYENHNRLLTMYEGCTGVKTGYTKKAGRCLVSSVMRDGTELVCVTLNAPDDWNDHMALYEYGFGLFSQKALPGEVCVRALPVAGGEFGTVYTRSDVLPEAVLPEGAEVRVKICLPRFVYAPVAAGDTVGCAEYTVNGNTVCKVQLIADRDIKAAEVTRSGITKWLDRVFG